jgi:hypothetical protein
MRSAKNGTEHCTDSHHHPSKHLDDFSIPRISVVVSKHSKTTGFAKPSAEKLIKHEEQPVAPGGGVQFLDQPPADLIEASDRSGARCR